MAWLTRLLPQDLEIEPDKPDMETVAYWLERFFPLIDSRSAEEIIVVFANRSGIEGNKISSMQTQDGEEIEEGNRVCYAGSSCVMRFQGGNVRMFEKKNGEVAVLGKGEEGVLMVDTEKVGLRGTERCIWCAMLTVNHSQQGFCFRPEQCERKSEHSMIRQTPFQARSSGRELKLPGH